MTRQTFVTLSRHAAPPPPLLLQPLAGPTLQSIRIEGDRPLTIGRALDCDIRLDNQVVSKRHAAVSRLADGWVVRDLGSRHGTFLSGVRLTPHDAVPLSDGDLLTIKPWVFQVCTRLHDAPQTRAVASEDRPEAAASSDGASISSAPIPEPGVTQQYDQLISASGAIYGAATIPELAAAILERALAATGFHRAAIIRAAPVDPDRAADPGEEGSGSGSSGGRGEVGGRGGVGGMEVLAAAPDRASTFEYSRSLVRAAATGTPALMIAPPASIPTGSVVRLGITRALCLPILVEGTVWGFLYLDARRGESTPRDDAVAFCGALVEMAGLAVSNIKGRELRKRLDDLQSDILAAAHVQRLIMPPAEGRFGSLAYAVRSRPGRLLSGDLFDVVPLADGRTAVMLGDVAGKGVSAAFLMAVAQTLVRSLLSRCDDPAAVLGELNTYLATMHDGSRFISLWLGIFDPAAATITAADGGHGYCVIVPPGRPASRLECAGGPVVGADPACRYNRSTILWPSGSRVVLFSDGVVEQCGADGSIFGLQRIFDSLAPSADPTRDVANLFADLERFASTPAFTDDVTIASIALDQP